MPRRTRTRAGLHIRDGTLFLRRPSLRRVMVGLRLGDIGACGRHVVYGLVEALLRRRCRCAPRDNADFADLRSQAARWAADNFDKLAEPDPKMPDLNDRAADNWRPLLAIADLVGGTWPEEARRAACLLSGAEQDGAIGVELLRDIRSAFGDDDVIRSSDLVAKLTADPERPWAEWKNGRPLTQKQLAGLLAPFHIISLTVHPPGLPDGKGYRRIDFEEAWAAYCPGYFRSVQMS